MSYIGFPAADEAGFALCLELAKAWPSVFQGKGAGRTGGIPSGKVQKRFLPKSGAAYRDPRMLRDSGCFCKLCAAISFAGVAFCGNLIYIDSIQVWMIAANVWRRRK